MGIRKRGTVKWFNNAKGYGFIKASDVEGDIFVHYSDIQGSGYKKLSEGDRVRFDMVESDKGLKALDVGVIGPALA